MGGDAYSAPGEENDQIRNNWLSLTKKVGEAAEMLWPLLSAMRSEEDQLALNVENRIEHIHELVTMGRIDSPESSIQMETHTPSGPSTNVIMSYDMSYAKSSSVEFRNTSSGRLSN